MQVREYFKLKLRVGDGDLEDMDIRLGHDPDQSDTDLDMPIDSECGANCVSAIDAAFAMIQHTAANHRGPNYRHYIVAMTGDICDTYIYG